MIFNFLNLKLYVKDRKTLLLLILTLSWMGVIFLFSSQPADDSSQVSSFVARALLDAANKVYNDQPPDIITGVILSGDHFVRKSGHVFEYMVLGVLVSSLFKRVNIKRVNIKRVNIKRVFVASAMVCLLYAVSDELHQLFVPGRACMATDVMLDFAAAVIGMMLVRISAWCCGFKHIK